MDAGSAHGGAMTGCRPTPGWVMGRPSPPARGDEVKTHAAHGRDSPGRSVRTRPRGPSENRHAIVTVTNHPPSMEDSPCWGFFLALLRPRAEDPLKATKKDDDLWGGMERGAGMERGGAWGVMHPPSPHEIHPPLATFAAPYGYSPTGAQYATAQYHHAQHYSPGQNMVRCALRARRSKP